MISIRNRRIPLLLLIAAIASATIALPDAAADSAMSFDIPPEDLGSALREFALQSNEQILFSTDVVQGKTTKRLTGTFTADSALVKLLAGSGLAFSRSDDGSLLIAVAGATDPSNPVPAEPLAQVTVSARRARLQPRAMEFVARISTVDGNGGLARWQIPVCPLVSGLPTQDGEFILTRISEIARVAGVPLAAEHCRPNLFVFITADPAQLLQAMEKRDREVTFGHAPPSEVDDFISTPRAARVWYDSVMEAPDSTSPTHGFPVSAEITARDTGGSGAWAVAPGHAPPMTSDWERSSHVARTTVWSFSYVYVVIDGNRLQGVTRGQLAAYVAMVGLAQIKRGAQTGDVPTILKLFDGAPQAALAGMSEWDRAFLRSLYTIEQKVNSQKGEIALQMVREIVP